ncbi:hypothetical protein C8J56DRAFT_1022111 [Mycena floridula]|nr:hypothetical protein C8J56DRAFT_1022111 [Mycena floridula]
MLTPFYAEISPLMALCLSFVLPSFLLIYAYSVIDRFASMYTTRSASLSSIQLVIHSFMLWLQIHSSLLIFGVGRALGIMESRRAAWIVTVALVAPHYCPLWTSMECYRSTLIVFGGGYQMLRSATRAPSDSSGLLPPSDEESLQDFRGPGYEASTGNN